MRNRLAVMAGLLGTALIFSCGSFAQTGTKAWPDPKENRQPIAEKDKKPAPASTALPGYGPIPEKETRRKACSSIQTMASRKINRRTLPTACNCTSPIRLWKASTRLLRPINNDPRVKCEPLGLPRANHYDLGVRIYQDENSIAMLYQYDNRWRIIWTDGRPLPKVLDGGVEINGEYQEQRWMGYSVGKWLDDTTLEVQTVGTMPDDRVWLDNTGRAHQRPGAHHGDIPASGQ